MPSGAVIGHTAAMNIQGWKKSSFSWANDCVEVGWQASSFCGANGCVDVAQREGNVYVRDSKDPEGATLTFTGSEWAAFVAGVKNNEFDPAGSGQ